MGYQYDVTRLILMEELMPLQHQPLIYRFPAPSRVWSALGPKADLGAAGGGVIIVSCRERDQRTSSSLKLRV